MTNWVMGGELFLVVKQDLFDRIVDALEQLLAAVDRNNINAGLPKGYWCEHSPAGIAEKVLAEVKEMRGG